MKSYQPFKTMLWFETVAAIILAACYLGCVFAAVSLYVTR